MAGSAPKRKGSRVERELVRLHTDAGLPCERVPLSGAAGGSFTGDLRIGRYTGEVKSRATGEGFRTIERWLGKNDVLFLRRDRTQPIVVMDWSFYIDLMKGRPLADPHQGYRTALAAQSQVAQSSLTL